MSEELPAGAGARVAGARPGGAWGSALTCQEFTAVRGVGFEPVGQVFGAAAYAAGYASGYSCPGAWGSSGDRMPAGPATPVPGRGGAGSFGPLVEAMFQARQAAIDRMTAECAALGGHGVVGVRLSRGSLPLGGLDFTAIGTAVRAPGAARGQRAPFTCDVCGQDFAKLITAGWVPAGLALGISIGSRHDDRTTARQARWGSGNAEVAGWTELVNQSRHDARRRLEQDVRRLGAEGVVITGMQMRVHERDCPVTVGRRDHLVEVTLTGTARWIGPGIRTRWQRGNDCRRIAGLDGRCDVCSAAGRSCRLAYCASVACGAPGAATMLSLVMSAAASASW